MDTPSYSVRIEIKRVSGSDFGYLVNGLFRDGEYVFQARRIRGSRLEYDTQGGNEKGKEFRDGGRLPNLIHREVFLYLNTVITVKDGTIKGVLDIGPSADESKKLHIHCLQRNPDSGYTELLISPDKTISDIVENSDAYQVTGIIKRIRGLGGRGDGDSSDPVTDPEPVSPKRVVLVH